MRSIRAVFLCALVALPLPVFAQGQRPLPDSFAPLAEKLLPAVVNVSTTQAMPRRQAPGLPGGEMPQFPPGSPFEELFREFFGQRGMPGPGGRGGPPGSGPPGAERPDTPTPRPRMQSLGSGFVIDASGLIVTNNHVVEGASEIEVTLQDESTLKAEVIGRDKITDLAVLRVKPTQPLTAVTWGDSANTKVGDWVLTIGNPFGLGGTVTAGILSAHHRNINAGPYDDFLQTDAPINRGNSGGPMFNLAGEVIGINTAIFSPTGGSVGIGFAIPSSLAQPVIEQLKGGGQVERGWIGVRIQPVTDDIAQAIGLDKARGALIADVEPNSPAARAKLQAGDVILGFDGKPVPRTRDLPRLVAGTPVDKPVKLTYWRDGKEQSTEIQVGRLDADRLMASARPQRPQSESEKPKPSALGLALAPLTPELREKLELDEGKKGVAVVGVADDSPAARKGIQPGDVIVSVGKDAVNEPREVNEKVEAAKKAGRNSVLLRVERDGTAHFIAIPIG
jgi:serine protease Do